MMTARGLKSQGQGWVTCYERARSAALRQVLTARQKVDSKTNYETRP